MSCSRACLSQLLLLQSGTADRVSSHFGECLRWVSMSVNLVPRDHTQFAAALSTFALNFSLQDEVVAKLQSEGLQDLEELRFFFDSEDHVGLWVAKLGLGDATLLQTARVRRAWSAVRLYFQQAEQDRSKVALADLDSILSRLLSGNVTSCGSKRKFTLATWWFQGYPDSSASACYACSTSGKSRICSSS